MMRLWALVAVVLVLTLNGATAERRVALVVGNAAYSTIGALANARNDAQLMREALAEVGFDVTLLLDADRTSFVRAIGRFGKALREDPETVGLFYYAGHGVQSFGTNFLLPVDAALSDQADLSLVAVEARAVLQQMNTARNKTNIVILDACRDNPFVSIPDFNDTGLAEMNPPTGTFLAYATAPGEQALDGIDGNSPFTAALAQEIGQPNRPIEQVFKAVRVSVLDATAGLQTPWDTSSLTEDFRFATGAPPNANDPAEQQLWRTVETSGDPIQVQLFLRAFPNGQFAEDARALLALDAPVEVAKPSRTVTDPAPVPPDPDDLAAYQTASRLGTVAAYRGYLQAYPQGRFTEIAEIELAVLAPETQAPSETPRADVIAEIAFDLAVTDPASPIHGRSIADLMVGTPLFAPVEGLPPEIWKNQSCGTCHQWTRETLCEQGNFYVAGHAAAPDGKPHPFGGDFRRRLQSWAATGCN